MPRVYSRVPGPVVALAGVLALQLALLRAPGGHVVPVREVIAQVVHADTRDIQGGFGWVDAIQLDGSLDNLRLPVFEAVLGQAARKQEANNKQGKAIDHNLLHECESVLNNLHTDLSSLMHVITKSVYLSQSQCSSLQTFIILLNHVDISKEYIGDVEILRDAEVL